MLTIEIKLKTVLKADTVAAVLIDYAAAQRALLEVRLHVDLDLNKTIPRVFHSAMLPRTRCVACSFSWPWLFPC